MALTKKLFDFLYQLPQVNAQVQQVRHRFPSWKSIKDYSKRRDVEKYGKERLRINSLRKNLVLPQELREMADKEIAALPVRSSIVQIRNRCVITSRPRGVVQKYRLSRIIFRDLADNNKISGIKRAMW